MFEPPDVGGACPFYSASAVAEAKTSDSLIASRGLLPFSVTKKSATAAVGAWIRSRWFLPGELKQIYRQDSIQGVYLPFWTYDAHTTSHRRRGPRRRDCDSGDPRAHAVTARYSFDGYGTAARFLPLWLHFPKT